MKTNLSKRKKLLSLLYIGAGIVLTLGLIVYFYMQLDVPFHDYGHQPLSIALVLLYFLLPYLLMKLIFRIASLRSADEEEFHMHDIWDEWERDLHGGNQKRG